jgi:hypothetical protein
VGRRDAGASRRLVGPWLEAANVERVEAAALLRTKRAGWRWYGRGMRREREEGACRARRFALALSLSLSTHTQGKKRAHTHTHTHTHTNTHKHTQTHTNTHLGECAGREVREGTDLAEVELRQPRHLPGKTSRARKAFPVLPRVVESETAPQDLVGARAGGEGRGICSPRPPSMRLDTRRGDASLEFQEIRGVMLVLNT